MAILGLMSVMLVGTAYAEEIRYTGDDITEDSRIVKVIFCIFTGN